MLSPVTKPVKFVIMLLYFPPLMGQGVVPLTWRPTGSAGVPPPPSSSGILTPAAATSLGLRSYFFQSTLRPEKHVPHGAQTTVETMNLVLTSLHSLGSVGAGSKLRIVFPLIVNEGPTLAGYSSEPVSADGFTYEIENPPLLPAQLYLPNIVPATTEYSGGGEDLSNFQSLSGDLPTLEPDKAWYWNGVSNVTVLAQDLVAADDAQNRLFWSGILIGVAGGGAIAFALELIGLGEKLSRRRKGTDNAPQEAVPQDNRVTRKALDDVGDGNFTELFNHLGEPGHPQT
jgi:hypothetical protein